MAVEKGAPRAQGLPDSLGWLTAGEVAERSGVVSCKPTAKRVCGVRLMGNGAILQDSLDAASRRRQPSSAPALSSKHRDGV
jgi:hypothetical protein